MKPNAFPGLARLKHRGSFLAVQEAGRKIVTRNLVFLVGPNPLGFPRLGLAVSRKAGNSVVRNRIKRVAREAFRLLKPLAGIGVDMVVIPRRHLPVPAPYALIAQDFGAFEREYRRRYGNLPPPEESPPKTDAAPR